MKELLYHQLIRAVTVVMPVVTSCSTVLLSMGSGDLPNALKIWFARASSRAAVRAMVAAETLLLYFIIAFSSHSTMDLIPQRETTSRCACLTLEA